MTLEEALNGWRWDGADGAALASAFAQGERTGRGILFAGTVGSGKTTAASLLAKKRDGLYIDCSNPDKASALREWRTWAMPNRSIVLDELGRDAVRNDFGNRTDVVAQFLREIYASWKEGEWTGRLYATTNLDFDGLRKAYDESITDRLLEMCVTCRFQQGRRVAANNAAPAPAPTYTASPFVALRDAQREDAIWDEVIAAHKAGDWRGCEAYAARNELGTFEVAWRVAVFDLGGVWSEADCAAVAAAWHQKLGRPKPRPRFELVTGFKPGLKKSPNMARIKENERPFELPGCLDAIGFLFRYGRVEDARWFARRAAAWCRVAVGDLPSREFPAARHPDEAIDWDYWVEQNRRQHTGHKSEFGETVAKALEKIEEKIGATA